MTTATITTKELRENMSRIVSDLRKGKSVNLSYRHKVIGVLHPVDEASGYRRGSAAGVRAFLETADFGKIPLSVKNSKKTFKQEIAELRNKDFRNRL